MPIVKHYHIAAPNVKVGKLGLLAWFVRGFRRYSGVNLQLYLDHFYFMVRTYGEDLHTVFVYRKSDRLKMNPPIVTHLDGKGSDASITQMKCLLILRRSIGLWKTQKRGTVEERDINSDNIISESLIDSEFLRTQLQNLKGDNVIPVLIGPVTFPPYCRPVAPDTPDYIITLYKLLEPKYPGILQNFERSWISTGNVNGVVTALNSMIRPQGIKVNNVDLHVSILRMLQASGFKSTMRIAAPVLSKTLLKSIPVPLTKKSGQIIADRKSYDYGSVKVNYSSTPTKAKLLGVEIERLHGIIGDLYHEVKEKFQATGDIEWAHHVFPIMMNKFAEKPEVRQEGEDPEKVRIFFLVSLLKFLMDSIVHIPFHHFLRRGYSYSIGHKWPGGGAEEFAREMNAWDPEWIWMWWDASKLVQSIVATLIVIFCMITMIIYEPGTIDYVLIANICAYCSDQTAGKYVTWLGKYCRYIIGVIFSGDLSTSHLDSLIMGAMVECAVSARRRELRPLALQGDESAKTALTMLATVAKEAILTRTRICRAGHPLHYAPRVYGDDGILGLHKAIHKYIDMAYLTRYAKEFFNIQLKASACGTSSKFFATPTLDGNVHTGLPYGPSPVFLKRHFVLMRFPSLGFDEPVVVPFRPRCDYDVRIGRTAQSIDDEAIQYARIIGLMWDTMGTNVVAWNMLKDAAAIVRSIDSTVEFKLSEALKADSSSDIKARRRAAKLVPIMDYAKKIHVMPDLGTLPDHREVLTRFLPSDIHERSKKRWQTVVRRHADIWNPVALPVYYD